MGGDNASESLKGFVQSGVQNAGQTVMQNVMATAIKQKTAELPI